MYCIRRQREAATRGTLLGGGREARRVGGRGREGEGGGKGGPRVAASRAGREPVTTREVSDTPREAARSRNMYTRVVDFLNAGSREMAARQTCSQLAAGSGAEQGDRRRGQGAGGWGQGTRATRRGKLRHRRKVVFGFEIEERDQIHIIMGRSHL